jgi:hypothetical protein
VISRGVPRVDTSGVVANQNVHPVMAALAARVPVTLLMDLADPAGPDSRAVIATETADLSWLGDLAYPVGDPVADRSVSDRAAG